MNQASSSPYQRTVNDRSAWAKAWLRLAEEDLRRDEVFGAFFHAYVALVAASTNIVANYKSQVKRIRRLGSEDSLEREAIKFAMVTSERGIAKFLESDEGTKIKLRLWQRELPNESKTRIYGVAHNPEIAQSVKGLGNLWSPLSSGALGEKQSREQAEALSEIFRMTRNLLFHGEKDNDPNGNDAEYLRLVVPLLIGVVESVLSSH